MVQTRKDNNQGKTDELTSHRDIDKSVWERNAQDAFSKWGRLKKPEDIT